MFTLYTTCLAPPGEPVVSGSTVSQGMGGYTERAVLEHFNDPVNGFQGFLRAVEKTTVFRDGRGWTAPVDQLGWELWERGRTPRPLAAATDTDPVAVYRTALADLLGGARLAEEVYADWTRLHALVTHQAPSRVTAIRPHPAPTPHGADHGKAPHA